MMFERDPPVQACVQWGVGDVRNWQDAIDRDGCYYCRQDFTLIKRSNNHGRVWCRWIKAIDQERACSQSN